MHISRKTLLSQALKSLSLKEVKLHDLQLKENPHLLINSVVQLELHIS